MQMLKNKALQIILALVYVVVFIVMWSNSKSPDAKDVPIVFVAGMLVAFINLISIKNKTVNTIITVINVVLFLINIVQFFAAYKMITGAFKN